VDYGRTDVSGDDRETFTEFHPNTTSVFIVSKKAGEKTYSGSAASPSASSLIASTA
jgi:hypothetical protein